MGSCGVQLGMVNISTSSVQVRTLNISFIALLFVCNAATQESTPARPYHDTDAYKIYTLLLPDEESYGFAENALIIEEHTQSVHISGACLSQTNADRFKDAVAGYNRIYKKKWQLQPEFQIAKPYRIVGAKVISALPDHPQGAVSYVSMSPVGFNRGKTQAIVFVESSCGGLCGSWRFHFLEKVHGKWREASVPACVGAL